MPKIQNEELVESLIGCNVLYIPTHANGSCKHPDCENGIITSYNDKNVFVRYIRYIRNSILQPTPQSTCPEDLIFI